MTDVLIVCVREDEVQAKALADMFERAGFSVGGAPADDAALRAAAAVVVVWSQASIRSRPFLEASQRAVNVGKGVIASLIEPPPPSSLNQSPAFDLRGWNGDPEDPLLDPLYFAVDRAAGPRSPNADDHHHHRHHAEEEPPRRAAPTSAPYGLRAAAMQQPAYEPPPPPPAPPQQRQRRAAPMAPSGHAPDPMSAEALRWRAIRHSRDPAAFLHYLAEYGEDGSFAELAQLRLKQLEDSNATPLKAAARAQTQQQQTARARRETPPAAPPPRQERHERQDAWHDEPEWHEPAPPPRREPPAIRHEPPPPRREPPPVVHREPPPPLPPLRPERESYATVYDEPKRRGGGGLAAGLAVFLVLGAGAIGAGMFFGSGQQLTPEPPAFAESEAPAPAAEEAPPELAEAAPLMNPPPVGGPSVPLQSTAAEDEPSQPVTRSAPEPTRTAAAERYEPRTDSDEAAVSLLPQPVAPAATRLASLETQPRPAVRPNVTWARRPTSAQVSAHYPPAAADRGIAARVQLACTVGSDLSPTCGVSSESPNGYGFGAAAVRVARSFRAAPTLADGSSSVGQAANLVISFAPGSN